MSMSRLALGITLSIIAIAIAVAGCVSFFLPVGFVCPICPRAVFVTHFFDGRMRLFWITRDEGPIRVTHHRGMPAISIAPRIVPSRPPGLLEANSNHAFRRGAVDWKLDRDQDIVRIRIADRRSGVGAFGAQWQASQPLRLMIPKSLAGLEVSFLRFPMWVPVLLLLLQPVKAIIFGPWRTRRRERLNQCIGCGYDLRALPSPRCPECGQQWNLASSRTSRLS